MRAVIAIAISVALGIGLAPRQTPQQPPPTFKSGVQLVEVDARVFDKSDRFVPDLTRDDFELLENGVPQKIDAMYLVGVAQPASAAADPAAVLPATSHANPAAPAAAQT